MWQEMTDNLYLRRSMKERIRYENDEVINYDKYTQRIIDDQKIYDEELRQVSGIQVDYYEVWE